MAHRRHQQHALEVEGRHCGISGMKLKNPITTICITNRMKVFPTFEDRFRYIISNQILATT